MALQATPAAHSHEQVVTFEQVNRVYAAAKHISYPVYSWYRGACEAITGMIETQPEGRTAATAFQLGREGLIPAAISNAAGSAVLVSSKELWS